MYICDGAEKCKYSACSGYKKHPWDKYCNNKRICVLMEAEVICVEIMDHFPNPDLEFLQDHFAVLYFIEYHME